MCQNALALTGLRNLISAESNRGTTLGGGKQCSCLWKNPPPHKGRSSSYISPAVAEKVKGKTDSSRALTTLPQGPYAKCQRDHSFNIIMASLPLVTFFAGRRRVENVTTIGTINNGSTILRELTKECGCDVGNVTIECAEIPKDKTG
ncbi:hypothetical protein PoB_005821500 [Plakobranchus ocellatus]|uniref:Uncharacterized protein n=1 Tax=Plakobranchus ocellatus TaxID=259542 RepID=A0AAV4CJE5_9GAST|nr:hypothetical protein PoB_005821500 [Plakobranchus ocellatus]